MKKIERWDTILTQYLESIRGAPYVWGETDCVSMVRRGLIVQLNDDPWKDLGSWKSIRGAKNRIPEDAGRFLESTGGRPINRNFATTGDVVLLTDEGDDGFPQLAMMVGGFRLVLSSVKGGVEIERVDIPKGARFYRYG